MCLRQSNKVACKLGNTEVRKGGGRKKEVGGGGGRGRGEGEEGGGRKEVCSYAYKFLSMHVRA